MPVAKHRGKQKIIELVIKNYWWPGVMKNMRKYVDKYDMCQRMKNCIEVLVGKLIANKVSEKLQIHLMVDFITKLLLVVEKNAILVVCNRLSKIAHLVAATEGMLVEDLARLFRDNMWKLHRLLESVISDRKPQFAVELTKNLNRMLGVKKKLSISFHPQTDGQTKKMNQIFSH